MGYFLNYLVSEFIIVLGQGKILHNFHVELLAFESLSFHPPSLGSGWNSLDLDVRNSVSLPTVKAKLKSTLFPHCYNKLFDFSFSRHASHSSETWFFLSKRIFVQNQLLCITFLRVRS